MVGVHQALEQHYTAAGHRIGCPRSGFSDLAFAAHSQSPNEPVNGLAPPDTPQLAVKVLEPRGGRMRIARVVFVRFLLLLRLQNIGQAGPRKSLHKKKHHAQPHRGWEEPRLPLPQLPCALPGSPLYKVVNKNRGNGNRRTACQKHGYVIQSIGAQGHLLICGAKLHKWDDSRARCRQSRITRPEIPFFEKN